MPQPINYMIPQVDPMAKFMQGLQSGRLLAQTGQERIKLQQAEELKKQYQTDLEAAFADGNPRAFARLTAKYPGQREALKQSFDILSDEQRENEMAVTGQVYSALQSGNTEVALAIMDEQIAAMKNTGKDTSKLQMLRDNMERDPKNAMGFAGLVLSSVIGPEKFAETYAKLGEETRTQAGEEIKRKKETQELLNKAADLDLTKAKTTKVLSENKKLDAETKKAILELEAFEKTGGIAPEKVFEQEKKIRDEYVKRTANFTAAQDAFSKIEASAQDKTGAGDIALITSFMKMLDPGSVVRETEFATAQDTGGLFVKLKNALSKAQTGEFLTDIQRKEFSSLSRRYMDAAKNQEKGVRAGLNKVVKNYKLNPDNVFGVIEEETAAAEAEPKPEQKVIRVKF
jgi:hypothetical protein